MKNLKKLLGVGAILMLLSGTAFALQAAAPAAAGAAAPAKSIAWGIVQGALAGIVAAIAGWASQKKDPNGDHEDFDIPQAVVTGVIGAGIGAYAAWKNLPIADVENLPILSSIIMGVEVVIKMVWRNGKVSVQRALGTVEAGTSAPNPTTPAAPPPATPQA